MLNQNELKRYSRHLKLEGFGEEAQVKLKQAKVLVIGAGGLASPVLQYLTAAGVGTIGIVDADTVDESNLQRQVLFNLNDIGINKAQAAVSHLQQQNPYVSFDYYTKYLTPNNALELFSKYDIIVDTTDNYGTRYLTNDTCVVLNKPFVFGAIFKFHGQVAVFNYQGSATYRCLFPTPPKSNENPSCSEIGVIGVLPGIIGSFQANEVIKIITGIGDVLANKILNFDALTYTQNIFGIEKNTELVNAIQQSGLSQTDDYSLNCPTVLKKHKNLTWKELMAISSSKDIILIDVRETFELPKIEEKNYLNIPLSELNNKLDQLENISNVAFFCSGGVRSLKAIEICKNIPFHEVYNLEFGLADYE